MYTVNNRQHKTPEHILMHDNKSTEFSGKPLQDHSVQDKRHENGKAKTTNHLAPQKTKIVDC